MALASKPATLSDGGSRSASIDLDSAIDEFHGHDGREYAYVLASGTIYLKKTKVLTQHSGGLAVLRRLPVCGPRVGGRGSG